MAETSKKVKREKEPGRIKQMWQVFQMTRRYDSRSTLYIVGAFALCVVIGVLAAIFLSFGSILTAILYVLAGILLGVLAAIIILGQRARRAAYGQVAGQPGAVGMVLKNDLRGSWQGSEMPVAVNPRSKDAVYRAVGRGGVVLISEGSIARTTKMLDDEKRKVTRILGNTVPVHYLHVGGGEGSIELHEISRALRRFDQKLTKPEVAQISNRLNSVAGTAMPIPKGIDPNRVRPQRAR